MIGGAAVGTRGSQNVDVTEIASVLEELILTGELPAGSRINVDDHARRLGVSHIPVREAVRILYGAGWVDYRPRQGAFVRGHDPVERADLFESRLVVEVEIARLAAHRRTAGQLGELDALLEAQAATTDPGELSAINCVFHTTLAGCANNAVLLRVAADLNKRTRFYYLLAATVRRDTSLAEHAAIVAAVRERDAERASTLLRAHIGDTAVVAAGLAPPD